MLPSPDARLIDADLGSHFGAGQASVDAGSPSFSRGALVSEPRKDD